MPVAIVPACVDGVPEGGGLSVPAGVVRQASAVEDVIEGHKAARTEQAMGLSQDGWVLRRVGIDDDHVVGTIGESRQHVQRTAGNQPNPYMVVSE